MYHIFIFIFSWSINGRGVSYLDGRAVAADEGYRDFQIVHQHGEHINLRCETHGDVEPRGVDCKRYERKWEG